MVFINNNCVLKENFEYWLDGDIFAGIKNGEEVYAAFRKAEVAYSGIFIFYFKNEYKFDFILESKPNQMVKESTKHHLGLSNINHIYTKEYLKNVVLEVI